MSADAQIIQGKTRGGQSCDLSYIVSGGDFDNIHRDEIEIVETPELCA